MGKFKARFVEGGTERDGLNEVFMGRRDTIEFEANSRVDAYIQLYRRLNAEGRDVTVLDVPTLCLGFTSEEIWEIEQSGVQLDRGNPSDGFQIEELIQIN